ncbi:hypothetical protein JOQ06_020923, partial [Pogonophryne albipinna]
MWLLLHPRFISTKYRATLRSKHGYVPQSAVELGTGRDTVHCCFTAQLVQDQDGNPTAAPGDFLAGLGACIGAVQSVYLHGLLATVNEGSSPGRLLVLNGAVRPDLVCETLEEWSCKPASLSPFSSALSGRAAFSLQLCPGSGPSVHPLSGPQYGLLSRISNTPLPLNSVIWFPVLKSCSAGGGRVFTLPGGCVRSATVLLTPQQPRLRTAHPVCFSAFIKSPPGRKETNITTSLSWDNCLQIGFQSKE